MKKFNIWYNGLWFYPIGILINYSCLKVLSQIVAMDIPDIAIFIFILILPLSLSLYIWSINRMKASNGQEEFTFETTFGMDPDSKGKTKAWREATYPKIKSKYLTSKPQGLVLGKYQGRYVFIPIGRDGINAFCIGSPGSGKSVMLLSILLSVLYKDQILKTDKDIKSEPFNFFLIDIKGELYKTLLKMNGSYKISDHHPIQVVQPSNRESYGWDVFYRIHKPDVSVTEMLKAVTDIADALIEESGDNPYFSNNAKKIMTGIMFFYAKKGMDFIPIIQKITRSNLGELLKEIVEEAEDDNDGVVLDKLKGFVGKEDNESLQDIEATLKTSLDAFSYPDIIYALDVNPHKTSPAVLNDGITSVDLAIEESMLLTYRIIFRLITMQVLRHAESDFSEADRDRRTAVIIDEAARCGKIEGIDSAMATLRSKHTSLLLFFQDMSQFKDIYKSEKASSILNICELKLFLSGSGDKSTTEYLSGMAGEYEEEKKSYGKATVGKKDMKYSLEKRKVIDGQALMNLREKGEAIAIIYGNYCRFKKLQYFKDPYLKKISDEIKIFNSEISE